MELVKLNKKKKGPTVYLEDILDSQEINVLDLVLAGKTSAEIATFYKLQLHAIDRVRGSINEKLGVRNISDRVDLVAALGKAAQGYTRRAAHDPSFPFFVPEL